jgi:PilZ domain
MKRSPKKPKRPPSPKPPRAPKPQKPKASKKAAKNGNNLAAAPVEIQLAPTPVEVSEETSAVLQQAPEVLEQTLEVREETVEVPQQPLELPQPTEPPQEAAIQLSENVELQEEEVPNQQELLEAREEIIELLEPPPQLTAQTETPPETTAAPEIVELQEQPVASAQQETLEAPKEIPDTPEESPAAVSLELPTEILNPAADTPANVNDAELETIPLCVDPLAVDPTDQSEYSVAEVADVAEVAETAEITLDPIVAQEPPAESPSYVELQDEIDQFMAATETHKPTEPAANPPAPSPKKEAPAPPPPPKPSDRRNHPRYAFQAHIQVTDAHSRDRIDSTVRDLSQRGCFANTPNPFALGTNVEVIITRSSKSFAAIARAVYNDPGKGMGLMFTDIEPTHRATLDAWISESRETSWLAVNRRRSQRVMMKLPIAIANAESSGPRWEEETHTVAVSAHGSLIVLKAPVARGQRLTLTNLSTKAAIECLVAHIDKPSSTPLQVGVEFLFADPAFWRVAFPPKDWTPRHPDAKSK